MPAGRWRRSGISSGGADLGYSAEDLADPGSIIQLGVAPVRIDIMAGIPGLGSFGEAWKNRLTARYGSEEAHYVGLAS